MVLKKITHTILLLSVLAFSLVSYNSACEDNLECCCCNDGLALLCECLTDQDGTESLGENLITAPRFKYVASINPGDFYSILVPWKACSSGFSAINKSSILYRSRYATRSRVLLI